MVDLPRQGNANIAAQILLESAQEILGEQPRLQPLAARNGFPPSRQSAAAIFQALQEDFGVLGSRGLALRMGRAAFKYGLKYLGDQNGFRATEFRLLPAPRRLETGLRTLAGVVSGMLGQAVTVSDAPDGWAWRLEAPPDQGPTDLSCYWMAGLLQAFVSWAGGGRFFRVVETECWLSGGAACIFKIDKRPLD